MSDALRIGVLGAARITPAAVIEPARDSTRVRVVAVAARDVERARRFAAEHGIPRVEPDYDALVRSPDIDAVYVALPNGAHAAWTIRALRANKHVLCEKPLSSNAAQAEAMVRTADEQKRVLMEAFHYRYHPLAARVLDLLGGGELGPVQHIEGLFTVPLPATDVRFDLAQAGGATMDLGCYLVHWARTIAGAEPTVRSARAVEGPAGIDVTMTAELAFPGGITAKIHCSMAADAELKARVRVRCERGEIAAHNPLAPQYGHLLQIRVGHSERGETVEGRASYAHQLDAFVAAAQGGARPLTAGADSIANMRVIDAIYRAAGLSPRS